MDASILIHTEFDVRNETIPVISFFQLHLNQIVDVGVLGKY